MRKRGERGTGKLERRNRERKMLGREKVEREV